MKKLTSLTLIFVMLISMSMSVFAAEVPEDTFESNYSFYHYVGDDNIIETPLEGEITVEHFPASEVGASARGAYTYTVTQTSKGLFEGFWPITNWALGPCNLTYTAEVGETVSCEISSTISAGVEVPAGELSAELGASVGGSTTLTASESVEYEIPKGYKGRVVMRYYQDIYNFDWEKKLLGITVSSGSGSAYGEARDPYYARQLVAAY